MGGYTRIQWPGGHACFKVASRLWIARILRVGCGTHSPKKPPIGQALQVRRWAGARLHSLGKGRLAHHLSWPIFFVPQRGAFATGLGW